MNSTFRHQFDAELLRSEKKRTVIIISIFSVAILFRLFNTIFFKGNDIAAAVAASTSAWIFHAAIIVFELFCLLYIIRRIRSGEKRIPPGMQYLNVLFETCIPSLIILAVARQYPSFNVLHSPAMTIYFLFIILSTLRLDFYLSFFCGLLACLSYTGFAIFLYNHFNGNDAAQAFVLLLSGIAAGLVARQIKAGINRSLEESERRHKAENLFGQQVSMKVAEAMLENDGSIKSKRMNVAVAFIDIRNFTQFAAGRTPEEIVKYQNDFFSIVIDAVAKHDGIVNQILGDGCMVTFGAPVSTGNISQKAVNASLEVLNRLNTALRNGKIHPTKIGIGIHTGEAVTGNIGTATRQQYSITGSVVIMASRIEQLNKEFHSQLLVSDEVYHSIDGNNISTELFKDIPLKGFEKPVTLYKLA